MGRGNHRKIEEEDTPIHASQIREKYFYRKTEKCFYRKPENGHYGTFYKKSGKGQQKEKLAKILSREAAIVLATLSTSPKKKEK